MSLPLEIIGLGRREVTFVWDEGHEGTFTARDLRLACRCANCIHELTGVKLLDPDCVPIDLTVAGIQLTGNYGVQLAFSDGHATGIYRWGDLRARCPCTACRPRDVL